jgi:glycosyltransferase involved in cell wall biosynthesis
MELSRAFALAAVQNSGIHLVIVGPDEEDLEKEFLALGGRFVGRVHRVGYVDSPEKYMSAADVLCLPSHREGFGAVLIEGASVGLPSIASRIYGITDAVEDGVTGILHRTNAASEIANAMLKLASDADLRHRMGLSAKERARNKFSEARVGKAFVDCYRQMLAASSPSAP